MICACSADESCEECRAGEVFASAYTVNTYVGGELVGTWSAPNSAIAEMFAAYESTSTTVVEVVFGGKVVATYGSPSGRVAAPISHPEIPATLRAAEQSAQAGPPCGLPSPVQPAADQL